MDLPFGNLEFVQDSNLIYAHTAFLFSGIGLKAAPLFSPILKYLAMDLFYLEKVSPFLGLLD
jgi:hypothetical protein